MRGERLSALESSFVCFEHPGRPVHVGAVAVFDGVALLDRRQRLRLDDVREHIAGRMPLLPRLHRRISTGPLGLDRPHWVDCPGFDVADHVSEVHLSPAGDEAALRRVAEEVHTRPLDPRRPPWELIFVTGLEGNRVGLVERAHHALVDGVGGVEIAAAVLDLDPTRPAVVPTVSHPGVCGAGPGGLGSTLGRALGAPLRAPATALQAVTTPIRHPTTVVRGVGTLAGSLSALLDTGVLAPHTSLTAATGPRRRLAWTRAP